MTILNLRFIIVRFYGAILALLGISAIYFSKSRILGLLAIAWGVYKLIEKVPAEGGDRPVGARLVALFFGGCGACMAGIWLWFIAVGRDDIGLYIFGFGTLLISILAIAGSIIAV